MIEVIPPSEGASPPDLHEVGFESFGVRIGLRTNDEAVLARFQDLMPPGARPCDPATAQQRFDLTTDDEGKFSTQYRDEMRAAEYQHVEPALELIDMHMCGYIAVHAPERIFVHAGVIAHEGRLVVMPGDSFAGKSTLVAALVRSGATYYSDEYAVLDEDGRVHPYPKALSLRGSNSSVQTTNTIEAIGGVVGEEPRKPSLIVMTTYRPGAQWRPRRLTSGEGVLTVLGNTVPAQERPAESLRAITRAVEHAVVIESERGEAAELVPHLLAELDG